MAERTQVVTTECRLGDRPVPVKFVGLVEEVRLFPADPITGRRGSLVERVELEPNALVFSHQHQVVVGS